MSAHCMVVSHGNQAYETCMTGLLRRELLHQVRWGTESWRDSSIMFHFFCKLYADPCPWLEKNTF